MSAGAGVRGGPKPPLTLSEAVNLYERWRSDEFGWLRWMILERAHEKGEFHADDLAGEDLPERNIIGAAVRSLLTHELIEETGEHRRSTSDSAHGRRSYVYRLTSRGTSAVVGTLEGKLGPVPARSVSEPAYAEPASSDALFDLPDAPSVPSAYSDF